METDNRWVKEGDVSGRMFTGMNGAILLIPAAGYISEGSEPVNQSSEACIWSSNVNQDVPDRASCYNKTSRQNIADLYPRYFGLSIRPVYVIKK
ncbi:MAG: hypothetical protein IJR87_01010 [Bacteroidaceae bacterium]|nr:hypothetical protein [Bacteroidaceae bacterium]